MSENKECLFYIDHNLPEGCGIWGGAIHKGACRLNSTDCNNTPECFIKKLYEQLQLKEQECERLKRQYKELGQCSKRMKEYFEKEKETLSNRFLKLKQILAEIKEIIEQGVKIHDDIIVNKQILQKISEVGNEYNE